MSFKKQIIIFNTLLSKLNIVNLKSEILAKYGVDSTKDLSIEQLSFINQKLSEEVKKKEDPEELLRMKRSNALNLASKLGIKKPDNWETFNAWMLKYSIYHKPLKNYNVSELNELIKQLQSAVRNNEKSEDNKFWRNFINNHPNTAQA